MIHAMPARYTPNHLRLFQSIVPLFITALMLIVAVPAQAQDTCDTIGENPEWSEAMNRLIKTMQGGNMQAAQSQAKALAEICSDAPVLNYLQGKIAESLGTPNEAQRYYQRASDNTYIFAVEPEIAQKIWYTRYEHEHPERTADALSLTNKRVDALETKVTRLQTDERETYRKLMWTGAGIGAGGLLLTITGAALAAQNDLSVKAKQHTESTKIIYYDYTIQNKQHYSLGWTTFGIGMGLLITGTVLTGIFGYKYTHLNINDEDITFYISPMNISIDMRF